MKKTIILLLVFVLTACKIEAQDSSNTRAAWTSHFHSFNTVQLLNGSTTTSFALNTVNGLQYGKFFTGIGVGFDYYYHTTIPLFLEARLDLAKQKGKFQLFGNGGVSIPFSSQNENLEYKNGSYKTGSLFGGGLDYLVPIKKEAIILGVAFSNKQVIQMTNNNIWNPSLNKLENIPIEDKYSFNRIAIRIGWMF